MTIKKGALVKVWKDDYCCSDFTVGYFYKGNKQQCIVLLDDGVHAVFDNCIEIPPALVKQLEELGK